MLRLWSCAALVALSLTALSFGQATKLDGTYRIQVVADGRYWQEDASDKLISTRSQPNDDTALFVLEGQADGSYRIKVKGSGRYLHHDRTGDKLLSTRYQPNDDNTRFIFHKQEDGSYRIHTRASKSHLHEDGTGDKLLSTRYKGKDTFTHFKLVAAGGTATRPATKTGVGTGTGPVTTPRPNGVEAAKARMTDLSKKTQAGTSFPTAQVPTDLDGFRKQMLAIGNLGRRDPDYRKKNGSKVATDLSGSTVVIPKAFTGGTADQVQKVFKAREAPPYFNDLVLNDALNKAAQFQAEYRASVGKVGHDGPDTFKGARMKEFWQRAAFFGYKLGLEGEGCGGSSRPTDFPEGWMKSDTHFRPWFNINADVREVGLGIARGADGTWYATVVSGLGK